MSKLIFVDIDGTLCDHAGAVPKKTKEAVLSAQKNGHLLYLCTGRSTAEIIPEIVELNFDGIIGANGGYIEAGGEVIFHRIIETKDLIEITDYFHQQEIEYYLECNDGIYGSRKCAEKILQVTSDYFKNRDAVEFKWFTDLLLPIEDGMLETLEVNKISFINTTTPFTQLEEQFSSKFNLLQSTVISFGEYSGEIALQGIDKRTAIQTLYEHLNIDKKDTIAIGDGNNDIPMFESVNYSIAMGNATDELKAIADEVTEDVDKDGFYHSFVRNKII